MKKIRLVEIITTSLIAFVGSAVAANIYKADNATALNVASSWTNNAVPGANDVAVWNGNIAGPITNSLGANSAWSGIKILSPGGPVQINAGFNLTNGAGGIDLSAATQDLTLSNNVVVNVPQNWNVASGRTLTLGGSLIKNVGGAVRFGLADSSANVVVTNATGSLLANSFALIGTVNDTDFAAVNGSWQIAVGSSVLGYAANSGNGTFTVVDFTTTTVAGLSISANTTATGFRFNQPNTAYNSWTVSTGGKTLTLNAILITTNVGVQPVYFTTSGAGVVRPYLSTGVTEFPVYQNNPAAPLVFQAPITEKSGYAVSLTKLGAGTLEIQSASTYTGGTRVYEGTLLLSGAGTVGASALNVYGGAFAGATGAKNYAATVVYSGATNAIRINVANGQFIQATNLTLNAGAHLLFSPTNGVSLSTTAAPLVVTNASTTLSAASSVTLDVTASPAVGQYPLIKYATLGVNGFAAFNLNLPPHIAAYLSNNTANATVDLVVTANTQPLKWAAASGIWDIATTANWQDASSATTTYQQNGAFGDAVVLDDSASGTSPITLTLNTNVSPASVTVNAAKNFSISGSSSVNVSGSLTKSGTGTLTLATANNFSGGLNLNGGTTVFSTLNNLGSGAITFAGGALKYSANTDDLSTRTVTFNAGGATIDDNGNSVSFANPVGNGGAGGLTKLGSGTLTLNGTNKFSGNTLVGAGTLALGGSSFISNSAAIIVSNSATLDVSASSPIVLQNQILAGSGTINGGITVASGATISPATNGTVGTLTINNGDLTVSGGTLALDVSASPKDLLVVNGSLNFTAGTVALNVSGTLANGSYKLIQYSGTLSGATANLALSGFSQSGKNAALSSANSGEIDLVISTQSGLKKLWQGGVDNSWDIGGTANWLYSGSAFTYAEGDNVTFDDTASQTSVSLLAAVNPASVTVSNNAATYTFSDGASGSGKISGSASLVKKGSGTLVIDTINNNSGATVISGGTLQIGDGSSTGDLGSGNITNNAALVFAQTDDRSVSGAISGVGTLTQQGSATLTLAAINTYSGATIISAGALQIGAGGAAGSLGGSAVADNSALIVDRSDSFALSNTVSGTGTFASIGSGTVILSGTKTWLGDTSISNGIVKLGGSEKIPDAATVSGATGVLNLEGVFDLNGFNETINALSGSAGVVSNSAAAGTSVFVVGDNVSSATFSGTIVDGSAGGKVQLVKQGSGTQTLNTHNTYSGGTILSNGIVVGPTVSGGNAALLGSGPVTFYGGTLQLGGYAGSATTQLGVFANAVVVPTNQTGTLLLPQRGDVNSTVTGSGTLNLTAAYTRGNVGGDWSAFAGAVNISSKSGASDNFRVNSPIGFPNAKVHLGAGVSFNGLIAGGIISIGELSGDASSSLSLGDSASGGAQPAVWQVGSLNTSTNFDGAITDTTGVIKGGTGAWTLTGANTYSGITAVTNGTLVFANDGAASANTSVFDLRSGSARLDVSALTGGTLNVGASQTLKGLGTVLGSVAVSGTLSPGENIGALTVTNSVTLGGTAIFRLNRTNSPATNDSLTAAAIVAGGNLIVTNVGPDLFSGSTFKLFSVPVTGSFASVNLPATNAAGSITYVWTNKLAIDGTIQLLSGASAVNTNATAIGSSFDGSKLTLNWPADRTGWTLQAQTNAIGAGLGTNWVDVAGSTLTNRVNIPVNAANGAVFFRLIYQ
jgi:autotransporter-associated beta strand protein